MQQGWLANPVKNSASSYPSTWQDVWNTCLVANGGDNATRGSNTTKTELTAECHRTQPPQESLRTDPPGQSVKELRHPQRIREVGHILTYFPSACGGMLWLDSDSTQLTHRDRVALTIEIYTRWLWRNRGEQVPWGDRYHAQRQRDGLLDGKESVCGMLWEHVTAINEVKTGCIGDVPSILDTV